MKTKTATYKNTRVEKFKDKYVVRGDLQPVESHGYRSKEENGAQIANFTNKNEMLAMLKEYGVTRVKDPDTGEVVNPTKMDLPKTVAKDGEHRFTDLVLGTRASKSGAPFDKRGFTLIAKDFDGKKRTMGVFGTPEEARKYAEKRLSCKMEDLRETKDFKDWASKWKTPEEEHAGKYPLPSFVKRG